MNNILITVFTISLMLGLAIQAIGQDGEKAKKILDASKSKFDALKDFSADFTYGISNPTRKSASIEKKGAVRFSKGKYAVIMDDQEIYCDGETLWFFIPEDMSVNIMDYDEEEGFDLESVFSLYQTNAKPRYDGLVKLNGHDCHKIYMSSTDSQLEFNQVELWINKSTQLIEKAVTTDRRQTRTVFLFENTKTNQGFGNSSFAFNTEGKPEIEIIDER